MSTIVVYSHSSGSGHVIKGTRFVEVGELLIQTDILLSRDIGFINPSYRTLHRFPQFPGKEFYECFDDLIDDELIFS